MPGKFKYDASTSGKLLDLGVVVTDTSVKEFRSVCHNVNRLKAIHSVYKKENVFKLL